MQYIRKYPNKFGSKIYLDFRAFFFQDTGTHHKLVPVSEPPLNLFSQVIVWQFKVLSGFSVVIHQSQETISHINYLNLPL